MRKLIHDLAAIGLLALAAGGGCFPSDDPMTEDEFCEEYARHECTGAGALCLAPVAGCLPVRALACRQRVAEVKTAARPYVAANAPRCLDRVREAYAKPPISAETLRGVNEVCARVFQGSVKPTQLCTVDYECEKDLICDKGRCGARREVAASGGCANIGEVCPRTQYCKLSPDIYLCSPRPERGMACSATEPCLDTLRCVGTCEERVPAGTACTGDGDCQTGYCDPYARICSPGLSFAYRSDSCRAFFGDTVGGPDGGAAAATGAAY